MTERKIRPYPMIYGDRNRRLPLGECPLKIAHRTLAEFQRWAIRVSKMGVSFEDYDVNAKGWGWSDRHSPKTLFASRSESR